MMNSSMVRVLCCLVLFCALFSADSASKKVSRDKAHLREDIDSFEDAALTLEVWHAIGTDQDFHTRGVVSIRSLKVATSLVGFAQEPLTQHDILNLKAAARTGGYYFIRTRSKFTDVHSEEMVEEASTFVSTFISACSLVSSGLSDLITIAGDGKGNVIGLSITTPLLNTEKRDCRDTEVHLPHHFNTSISLDNGTPGPVPDAQGFLQKAEKEDRDKREGKDGRSFLQKYWLYIVIGVVMFMMISGSGGGGGGGGGGGQ